MSGKAVGAAWANTPSALLDGGGEKVGLVVGAKPTPAAVSGGTSVQIGAYDSTDSASAEYAKVASSYGLFVGGAGKKIEKVTTPKGVFYRTAFTGLTPDKARAFCAALKANGRDCIIR